MSAINMIFGLKDNVSPAFDNISKKTLGVVNEFNRLQKQTESLNKAWDDLQKMGLQHSALADTIMGQIVGNEQAMKDLANGIGDVNDEEQAAMIALNQSLELVQKGWDLVKKATQEAYELMDMYNQKFNAEFTAGLKMHNILGASSDQIKSMYAYAEQMQKSSIFSSGAFSSAWSELSKSIGSLENMKKLTPIMIDMAVTEKGLYATTSDLTSAASQLQRALNGQARMLRWNYGLTEAQVKQLESLNDVTEKTNYLVEILGAKTSNANNLLLQTAQGGLLQARNEFNAMKEALGEKLMPYITQLEQAFYQLIQPGIQWLIDNLDTLLPLLISIAAIFGVIVATIALFKFGPLILFIGLVGVIIKLIDTWANQFQELQGQTHTTLGRIMAFLATFVAFVYDSVIVPIWNTVATVANFLANVFKDPIASIKILFIDMGITVTGILSVIASAIDALFGTNFKSAVDGWTTGLNAAKNEIKAASTYEEIMPILDNWDMSQAARQGYAFGDTLSSNISKAIDDNEFFSKFGEALVPGADGTTALNTTTGDSLLGEEDIQLLFDIATRDVRFDMQQITPEVTISFNGDINSPMDIDSVSEAIISQLEEVYDSDLEVVTA